MYNLEAVAAYPKIFMGLALVHFQKYWLLSKYVEKHNNLANFEQGKCYKIGTKSSIFCKKDIPQLCNSVLL